VQALHASILDKFVFSQQSLQLCCLVGSSSMALAELFVFSGRAIFKGLEKKGGLGVWELVSRKSVFFSLLAEHHVGTWLHEGEQPEPHEHEDWHPTPLFGVQKSESGEGA
jgi:hypothetical protein